MTGNTDIEDSLQRLDKLTQNGARMASAERMQKRNLPVQPGQIELEKQLDNADITLAVVNDKVVDVQLDPINRSLSL